MPLIVPPHTGHWMRKDAAARSPWDVRTLCLACARARFCLLYRDVLNCYLKPI